MSYHPSYGSGVYDPFYGDMGNSSMDGMEHLHSRHGAGKSSMAAPSSGFGTATGSDPFALTDDYTATGIDGGYAYGYGHYGSGGYSQAAASGNPATASAAPGSGASNPSQTAYSSSYSHAPYPSSYGGSSTRGHYGMSGRSGAYGSGSAAFGDSAPSGGGPPSLMSYGFDTPVTKAAKGGGDLSAMYAGYYGSGASRGGAGDPMPGISGTSATSLTSASAGLRSRSGATAASETGPSTSSRHSRHHYAAAVSSAAGGRHGAGGGHGHGHGHSGGGGMQQPMGALPEYGGYHPPHYGGTAAASGYFGSAVGTGAAPPSAMSAAGSSRAGGSLQQATSYDPYGGYPTPGASSTTSARHMPGGYPPVGYGGVDAMMSDAFTPTATGSAVPKQRAAGGGAYGSGPVMMDTSSAALFAMGGGSSSALPRMGSGGRGKHHDSGAMGYMQMGSGSLLPPAAAGSYGGGHRGAYGSMAAFDGRSHSSGGLFYGSMDGTAVMAQRGSSGMSQMGAARDYRSASSGLLLRKSKSSSGRTDRLKKWTSDLKPIGVARLQLRYEPPVTGCELKPYIVLKCKGGGTMAADESTDNILYRWYRSVRRMCSISGCGKPGTLQCLSCCKLGVTDDDMYFCSTTCMEEGWKYHQKKHGHLMLVARDKLKAKRKQKRSTAAIGARVTDTGEVRGGAIKSPSKASKFSRSKVRTGVEDVGGGRVPRSSGSMAGASVHTTEFFDTGLWNQDDGYQVYTVKSASESLAICESPADLFCKFPPPIQNHGWELASRSRTYTPTDDDIGRMLLLEIAPIYREKVESGKNGKDKALLGGSDTADESSDEIKRSKFRRKGRKGHGEEDLEESTTPSATASMSSETTADSSALVLKKTRKKTRKFSIEESDEKSAVMRSAIEGYVKEDSVEKRLTPDATATATAILHEVEDFSGTRVVSVTSGSGKDKTQYREVYGGLFCKDTVAVLPRPSAPPSRRWLPICEAASVYYRKALKMAEEMKTHSTAGSGTTVSRQMANYISRNAPRLSTLSARSNFTVLSYNCLAPLYCNQSMYPYAEMYVLNWDYRKFNILREVCRTQPDIVSLQEIQANHFDEYFLPELRKRGYDGIFRAKIRERVRDQKSLDGCAIFFKSARFEVISKYHVDFNDSANSYLRKVVNAHNEAVAKAKPKKKSTVNADGSGLVDTKSSTTPPLAHSSPISERSQKFRSMSRRLKRGNVALILVLREKASKRSAVGGEHTLVVANTHVYWDPAFTDVKVWQSYILCKELQKLRTTVAVCNKSPIVLCGDFNSEPQSAVYDLLAKQRLGTEKYEQLKATYLNSILPPKHEFTHDLHLSSAYGSYEKVGEPQFTNYTSTYKGTLDYVLFSRDSLKCVSVLEQIPESELSREIALPNSVHSSDHVSLVAEFAFADDYAANRKRSEQELLERSTHHSAASGQHASGGRHSTSSSRHAAAGSSRTHRSGVKGTGARSQHRHRSADVTLATSTSRMSRASVSASSLRPRGSPPPIVSSSSATKTSTTSMKVSSTGMNPYAKSFLCPKSKSSRKKRGHSRRKSGSGGKQRSGGKSKGAVTGGNGSASKRRLKVASASQSTSPKPKPDSDSSSLGVPKRVSGSSSRSLSCDRLPLADGSGEDAAVNIVDCSKCDSIVKAKSERRKRKKVLAFDSSAVDAASSRLSPSTPPFVPH